MAFDGVPWPEPGLDTTWPPAEPSSRCTRKRVAASTCEQVPDAWPWPDAPGEPPGSVASSSLAGAWPDTPDSKPATNRRSRLKTSETSRNATRPAVASSSLACPSQEAWAAWPDTPDSKPATKRRSRLKTSETSRNANRPAGRVVNLSFKAGSAGAAMAGQRGLELPNDHFSQNGRDPEKTLLKLKHGNCQCSSHTCVSIKG